MKISHIGHSLAKSKHVKLALLSLKNILHVPNIKKNLLSIGKLTFDNNCLEFDATRCFVKDKATKKVLPEGKLKDSLYQLDIPIQMTKSAVKNSLNAKHQPKSKSRFQSFFSSFSSNTMPYKCSDVRDVWHRRLGHPSTKILSRVLGDGVFASLNKDFIFRDACQYGKSHGLPFKSSKSTTSKPLEIVSCDLWGRSPLVSTSGFRYYVSFVDHYSRYTFILSNTKEKLYKPSNNIKI